MSAASNGVYDNPYQPDNVYAHVLTLLQRHLRTISSLRDIHLDLGCGYGRIAEPLTAALNLVYVGIDADEGGLASLRDRNFEAHRVLLTGDDALFDSLQSIIGDRTVRSISLIDTLEHLPDGDAVLSVIRRIALRHGAFVAISVPNVTHRRVGIKLAVGKWDYTRTGLLDHTHVRLFGNEMLTRVLRHAGLHAIESNDVVQPNGDGEQVEEHPALLPGSTLNRLLSELRDGFDDDGDTYQFVRICVAGPSQYETSFPDEPRVTRPFLSVITRTQGKRIHTLREVFTCLAGQTDTDFEVLVVGHCLSIDRQIAVEQVILDNPLWLRSKVRFLRVDRGTRTHPLNVGFENAIGSYIVILDDDDLPMADWVEVFHGLARAHPGSLVRAVAVRQDTREVSVSSHRAVRAEGSPENRYAASFDIFDHVLENQTPPGAIAFPRGVFHGLKLRFDESLTTTEDWDYIVRAAIRVGVVSSPKITFLYRWWTDSESSRTVHSGDEWQRNDAQIVAKMDSSQILLPIGSASRIRALMRQAGQAYAMMDQSHVAIARLRSLLLSSDAARDRLRGMLQEREGSLEDVRRREAEIYGNALAQAVERSVELRHIFDLFDSRSWQLTAPLRVVGRLSGKPAVVGRRGLWDMSVAELRLTRSQLEQSTSLRVARLFKRLRGLVNGVPGRAGGRTVPSLPEEVAVSYVPVDDAAHRVPSSANGTATVDDAFDGEAAHLEERLSEVGARLAVYEAAQVFAEPGHFYSAVPNSDEVADRVRQLESEDVDPGTLSDIDLNVSAQLAVAKVLAGELADGIPFTDERQPGCRYYFDNDQFGYTDAIVLHAFLRAFRPRRVVEVGSGYSSAIMLDTNELYLEGQTSLTFIEPYPDRLKRLAHAGDLEGARLLEQRVQDADKATFAELDAGDILFIDSSHVVKTGSDVEYLLRQILPIIAEGVYVHFHDIFYPFEYPITWLQEGRHWNECYAMRHFLSYNSAYEILMFNNFMSKFHGEALEAISPLCRLNPGGSLWLRKVRR